MRKALTKEELRSAKMTREEFEHIERNPFYVVLDSLKCAHNIGTILRLSDALLVKKVFICGNTIIPPNRKIKEGSRGAERWVPWEYCEKTNDAIEKLKKEDTFIVSAELTDDSIDYEELDFSLPVGLVLGREYDGVSEEVLRLSDSVVRLPIYGMSNSLNVSTTASVLMYEIHKKARNIGAIRG